MSETTKIIEPLLAALPYPEICTGRWIALRDVKLGSGGGRLDLLLVSDEPALILIEAKKKQSSDSRVSVAGQLLLYYAHALEVDAHGIQMEMRRAALQEKHNQYVGLDGIAAQRGVTAANALQWAVAAIERRSIRAFVALDAWNEEKDRKRLAKVMGLLGQHGIPLRIVICAPSGLFIAV